MRPGWERSGPKLESKTVLKIMNVRLTEMGVGLQCLLTGLSGASKGGNFKTAYFLFEFLRLR